MTPEQIDQALEKIVPAFEYASPGKVSSRVPDFRRAMERLTLDQWKVAAETLRNRPNAALPSSHEFAHHCRQACQGEGRRQAEWDMGYLREKPYRQRMAVRDWLVNRYEWPTGIAEPDEREWPFRDEAEQEVVRAITRVSQGNRPDVSGAGLVIDPQRLKRLAGEFGRAESVRLAIANLDDRNSRTPDDQRRSFSQMALEIHAKRGVPMTEFQRALFGAMDTTLTTENAA